MKPTLDEIAAAAKAATGANDPDEGWKADVLEVGYGPHVVACAVRRSDANFIAIANPQTVLDLVARVREAEAAFLACAQTIGIVYEADGHASAPGPVDEVTHYIREAVHRADRLQDERDGLAEALRELIQAAHAAVVKARTALGPSEHGEVG